MNQSKIINAGIIDKNVRVKYDTSFASGVVVDVGTLYLVLRRDEVEPGGQHIVLVPLGKISEIEYTSRITA